MRTLEKNKIEMYYSVPLGEAPIYEKDENGNYIVDTYTDSEGQVYEYYRETGEKKTYYATPVKFFANKANSGSNSQETEYGLTVADYSAVIATTKGAFDIKDGTLIWDKSEIVQGEEQTIEIDGKTYTTTDPVKESSDYMVVKCSDSVNETRYYLKATNK